MTKLLEKALEAVRGLSEDEQDEIARTILALVGDDHEPVSLTDDERVAIARSKGEAARGAFATDEDVRALWAKYGL
ncbi:MAG TPA: hypothetical protein VGF29_05085 [Hyphomicrobiaceae bacterium]|jgi:hypothetical protein